MRPVRKITAKEENYREVELIPGNPMHMMSKVDGIEPEPVGTIVLMAFRITDYDPDCDGSLMARLEHIDRCGETTGWRPSHLGLYPDTDLVVSLEEWSSMFEEHK